MTNHRAFYTQGERPSIPRYLGADLTDRYANGCKDIDVCGLTPGVENKLAASFWSWRWDSAPRALDVTVIAKELTPTQAAMLDGPQGLATKGEALRACERQAAAVGKTPDRRPELGRPFAGFICSALDLFEALRRAGTNISPPRFLGGVSEVYPGHIWKILGDRCVLPKKSTHEGRLARKCILEALGVSGLPELPTHDQNDACVAALLAVAADGKVPGIALKAIGFPLFADADGTLREGLMAIPEMTAKARQLISEALRETCIIDIAESDAHVAASLDSGTADGRAKDLLDWFIATALEGNSQVCTYSWAYRHLFTSSYDKWAPGIRQASYRSCSTDASQGTARLGGCSFGRFRCSKEKWLAKPWPLAIRSIRSRRLGEGPRYGYSPLLTRSYCRATGRTRA